MELELEYPCRLHLQGRQSVIGLCIDKLRLCFKKVCLNICQLSARPEPGSRPWSGSRRSTLCQTFMWYVLLPVASSWGTKLMIRMWYLYMEVEAHKHWAALSKQCKASLSVPSLPPESKTYCHTIQCPCWYHDYSYACFLEDASATLAH